MQGADVEQLRRLARSFDTKGNTLKTMSAQVTARVNATGAWSGPDAQRFRSEWNSSHKAKMVQAADALHQAAQALNKNADQQQQASAADGGGVAGASGTGTASASGGLGHILDVLKEGNKIKGTLLNLITKPLDVAKLVKNAMGKMSFEDIFKGATDGSFIAKIAGGAGKMLNWMKDGLGEGLLANAGKIGGIVSKVGLAGTVLGGAMSAITGDGYGGLRGATSRVLGGAGAIGAGALLMGGETALMASGVGAPIAVGAVAAYGLWEAGNFIWDNRAAIGHFAVNAYHAVGGAISDAGHAIGHAASSVGHFVSHLVPHISIF